MQWHLAPSYDLSFNQKNNAPLRPPPLGYSFPQMDDSESDYHERQEQLKAL